MSISSEKYFGKTSDKKMNRKGFTLVELLAVIVIIAIISMIAIPNTIKILETSKKEHMLNDAKRMISNAKERVNASIAIREETNHLFPLSEIKGDIETDTEGKNYNSESYVKYYLDGDSVKYCITLIGSKYAIGQNTCVLESNLTLSSVVQRT